MLLAVYLFCGRCALYCILLPLSLNCSDRGHPWDVLRALCGTAGHVGNAALTAPQLRCEIRTQTSCSPEMRTFPAPQGIRRDSQAAGSAAGFSQFITSYMLCRISLLILYVTSSEFLSFKRAVRVVSFFTLHHF